LKNKHILVIFACLFVANLIAVKVDIYNQAYAVDHSTSDVSFFMRFLGEGKSIVSRLSILQADRYFHGGVGYFDDESEGGLAIAERYNEDDEHTEDQVTSQVNPFNILFKISREVDVTEHIHLQSSQIKEIIPWLYYAAEIDSHNVTAYVLTGFYLCDRLEKVDEGIAFLRKGLKKNPESWEINADLGRIYFQHIEDYEVAIQYLSKAWELLQIGPHDKFQERYVLSYLTRSYEALGMETDAVPFYERLNTLFPNSIYDKNKNKDRHLFI